MLSGRATDTIFNWYLFTRGKGARRRRERHRESVCPSSLFFSFLFFFLVCVPDEDILCRNVELLYVCVPSSSGEYKVSSFFCAWIFSHSLLLLLLLLLL